MYTHILWTSDSATNTDVSEFLRHRLEEIRMTDVYLGWASDEAINALAIGGLFIWASTACLYIEGYDPDRQLSELINKQSESHSSGPFYQLDILYKAGLQSAGLWNYP